MDLKSTEGLIFTSVAALVPSYVTGHLPYFLMISAFMSDSVSSSILPVFLRFLAASGHVDVPHTRGCHHQ